MKCKVKEKALLVVDKGSVVEVDELQYESAKHLLQPIEESKGNKKGKE